MWDGAVMREGSDGCVSAVMREGSDGRVNTVKGCFNCGVHTIIVKPYHTIPRCKTLLPVLRTVRILVIFMFHESSTSQAGEAVSPTPTPPTRRLGPTLPPLPTGCRPPTRALAPATS